MTMEDTDDWDALHAQAVAEEEALAGEDEVGPDDESGELAEEDDAAADPGSDDDDDLEDEDDVEADDEDEDDEADEPLEDEDQAEEPNPELEAERAERKRLEGEIASLREQAQQTQALLQQLIQGGAVPPQQQQQAPRVNPELERAVYAAFTGDDEAFKSLPKQVQNTALQAIRHREQSEARYTLDPEARYRDQFAHFAERHFTALLNEHLRPILEDRANAKVDRVLEPHKDVLSDPELKKEFAAILDRIPGGPDQWEQRVALAREVFDKKHSERKLTKKEQNLRTRERQLKAKQSSRRRSGKGARGGKKQRRAEPTVESPEDVFSPEYQAWLAANMAND